MQSLEASWPAIDRLAQYIHATPELRFQETRAVAAQTELLAQCGFRIEAPYGGLDTAFRASFGEGSPVLAFTSEYDALPDIGHACGHNLIATVSIGAAIAVAGELERSGLPGQVCVIGTPGEEMGGGKVLMLRNGAFDGIDAVMQSHPTNRDVTDPGGSAIVRYDVAYKGLAAHAAAAPEDGRNALDAVMLFFQGINAWRQHLPESCRVHGIVTDGGAAPNIIPAHAAASFYLRSLDNVFLDRMVERFHAIAQGAALMTDTEVSIKTSEVPYKAGTPNPVLNRAFIEESAKRGVVVSVPDERGRASSDFNDISEVLPAIQARFNICPPGESASLHSERFREFAGSPLARERARSAAERLAGVGWRFFSDAAFREEVFRASEQD